MCVRKFKKEKIVNLKNDLDPGRTQNNKTANRQLQANLNAIFGTLIEFLT